MRRKNKGTIMTQRQFERDEQNRKKIEEYFLTGQISPEVAVFTLHLLGFSVVRTKEVVKQWKDKKANTE
jgi:hypothetical protein